MVRDSLQSIKKRLDDALTFECLDEAKELAKEGYALARSKEVLHEMEYFKGEIALIEGKIQTAILHFDKAIQFNPFDAESYNDKALAYAEIGNYDEALEWIERGIEANPDYATLYHNKGWVLAQTGRLIDAVAYYKKALKFDSKRAVTHICLAEAYEKLGDVRLSFENYKKADALLPHRYKEIKEELLQRLHRVQRRLKRTA